MDSWSTEDDAAVALAGYGANEPLVAALTFLHLLEDDRVSPALLRLAVTDESLAAWGDFETARAAVHEFGDWGVPSFARRPPGVADVAYVPVLAGVEQSSFNEAPQFCDALAVVTLVWNPTWEAWLVHALGDAARPEQTPRTETEAVPRFTGDHITTATF